MDYPRVIVELSKTISAVPLLEGVESTPDDCMLREHNAYLRLLQPEDDAGEVSTENISKVPKKLQEFRQEHRFRVPKHDAIVEVKTCDTWLKPHSAYRDAPSGVRLMRLYLIRNLRLRVGTN